jgi:hypothetical protein
MFYPNQIIKGKFYVKTTGLSQGAFTLRLEKDGVLSGISITITEVGTGYYLASFTPDSAGIWTLSIDYNDYHLVGEWPVRVHLLNEVLASFLTAGSIGAAINKIRVYVRNRLVISGGNYTIYEDDDTTPHETGTVSTTERNPS